MRGAVLGGVMLAGACFSPHPPAGAPCGDQQACPSGLVCTAQNTCEPIGGSGGDGGADGPGDSTSGCSWSTHFFDACATPTPLGDLHLTQQQGPWSIDTDSGVIRGRMNITLPTAMQQIDQNGTPALLLSVNHFIVDQNTNVRITGSRPLIVAAHSSISVASLLDISANHAGTGAGSNPGLCGSSTGFPGAPGTGGAGGGAGGAFQGQGGHGGQGDSDTGPNAGGAEGTAVNVPMIVRGGCKGGAGGSGGSGTASGGSGGGALQLTAHDSITFTASGGIDAGGGGGLGGIVLEGGGGGGGAGGFIGLEAPMIVVDGVLAANGGGGGAGANDTVAGGNGNDGQVGSTGAAGGTNSGGCGSSGGGGASDMRLAGRDNTNLDTCGGGGGGGGAGYILMFGASISTTSVISPPATNNPF